MVRGRQVRAACAALLALAVLAAACGDEDDDATTDAIDSPTTSSTAVTAPAGGGGSVTTTARGVPGGGGGGGPGTTAAGGGAGPPPTTTTGTSEPAVIAVGSRRVGEVAPALLQPGRGDRVVLEVRAQSGAEPAAATLDHLVQVIGAASGKSVSIDGADTIGGGARDWSAQDLVAAASSAAQVESGRAQVVLRLLFVHGTYAGDTGVLGVAVAGDVAAVFADQVSAAAGILVPASTVEDAVTMHEVGHLLGLVDLLLGTGRGDPAHPGHSRNKRSVMYWQVESDLISQLFDGGVPRDFDDDDRAELAQIRAG